MRICEVFQKTYLKNTTLWQLHSRKHDIRSINIKAIFDDNLLGDVMLMDDDSRRIFFSWKEELRNKGLLKSNLYIEITYVYFREDHIRFSQYFKEDLALHQDLTLDKIFSEKVFVDSKINKTRADFLNEIIILITGLTLVATLVSWCF